MSEENEESDNVIWKHIGLHGHSVGAFSCEPKAIVWKSAFSTRDDSVSGTTKTIPAVALKGALWSVFGRSGHLRVQTKTKPDGTPYQRDLKHELRFDGFNTKDVDMLKSTLKEKYNVELHKYGMSSAGTQYGLTKIQGKNIVFRHCILEEAEEEGEEFEPREGEEMMSLDLTEVSQCVLPGNNRNEIELQFPESDTVEAGTDQLVAIRFYIPPDPEQDPTDKSIPYPAELLQQRIMQTASIRKTTGDILVEFEQSKGTFLTPRGRYAIELYDWFLRLRGQKYDYKIKYDDINRLFLLPKPDEVHMAFVIALDKPIRQGQQRYQYLVLQATKDPDEVTVNMDEETLKKEYGGELQPVMRGSLSNLVAKTFKVIAKKKVFIPGKFANANQQACVKCALRANEGLLYPLEKQFVFIHKPPVLIRFNEVESVEFQRYAGGQGSTRNFDLCVNLKASAIPSAEKSKEYTFMGIDRSDYTGLYNFLSGKKIKIKNLEGVGAVEPQRQAPVYNEDEIYGGPDPDGEEESEDDDYDEAAAVADEQAIKEDKESDEESIDDDDFGDEIDDELDSDLEEARKGDDGGKKKKKKKAKEETSPEKSPKKKSSKGKKKKADSDDDSDGDDDEDDSPRPKKKVKKANSKDPNKPKGKMSSYMYYSKDHRARIQEENPEATFGEVAKLLGLAFKALSAEDRKKYDDMAKVDKQRHAEEMKNYTPPEGSGEGKGATKAKGKGKGKKDPNEPKRPMTAFMLFSNANRQRVKEENPGISFGDIGRKMGELFKALSPEERAKYDEKNAKDKERYKREMDAYKAKGKADAAKAADDGSDSDGSDDSDDSD
ncbi:FACT complex subunit SSRP1 [Seminavis robusta]|uniref:FACT complex subunit SSRP1 n=1 Tax=Seminavis robusta TaxID=568900 RepID=A0A9N8EZ77_9STRA|nr:FACT complex subunit SSRP1 [Seminavis robusta]|eukprot:Sro1996_g310030.1 FACT complex subunit SSRP1 (830) ;mRNA; f:4362-7524